MTKSLLTQWHLLFLSFQGCSCTFWPEASFLFSFYCFFHFQYFVFSGKAKPRVISRNDTNCSCQNRRLKHSEHTKFHQCCTRFRKLHVREISSNNNDALVMGYCAVQTFKVPTIHSWLITRRGYSKFIGLQLFWKHNVRGHLSTSHIHLEAWVASPPLRVVKKLCNIANALFCYVP